MADSKKSKDIQIGDVNISFDDAIDNMFAIRKETDFARLRKMIMLNNVLVDDIENEDDKVLMQNVITNIIKNDFQHEIYVSNCKTIRFYKRPFISAQYAIDSELHPITNSKLHLIFANLLNKSPDT